MRPLALGIAAAGLVALGLAVVATGRAIQGPVAPSAPVRTASEMFGPAAPVEVEPLETSTQPPSQPARAVDPALVAPPPVDRETLVRARPRDPLGPLGQAQPPKKKERGPLLFNPVATASATFESKGLTVDIAGTRSIDPAETCTHGGAEWPCGTRALTAVRLWLRGRALACDIPPGADLEQVVVACRLGNQDVGGWLVANGWAQAAEGGPYAEAEAKAREEGLGIFGAPPAALPPAAPARETTGDVGAVEEQPF